MDVGNYLDKDFSNISHLVKKIALLVTATDTETEAVHLKLMPIVGLGKIIRVFKDDQTFYIGKLGQYPIVHVQSGMGSLSRTGSIMTVSAAIESFSPPMVVMVGIAFGVDDEKQNIGDVLISESIIPYNSRRVGKDEIIPRGIEAPSGKILLNRFKNIKLTWEHILDSGTKARLIPTRLLSGEELVDNLEYRNQLISKHSESQGGEMEGAGVYAACDGKAEWILVKGICDFADGDKGNNKKQRQQVAIQAALSVCVEVFNSPTAFFDLGLKPIYTEETTIECPGNLNVVLFDVYQERMEQYYLTRDEDKSFSEKTKQYGVWIYGPPGVGKSNLIIRHLLQSKKKFIQVTLASCIGMDVSFYFFEIYSEIASALPQGTKQINPNDFNQCAKAILNALVTLYKDQEVIIFIEEIPISSTSIHKQFSDKLFSLIFTKSQHIGLENVRFVLSSIDNPESGIEVFQQKIHQQIAFMPLEAWNDQQLSELIGIIESNLNFYLNDDVRDELLSSAMGSPRFVKKFFRSVFSITKKDAFTLKSIIQDTKRDLRPRQ